MSFRVRLLLGLALVALVPLALLALGVRREMTARLGAQYERRVGAVTRVVEQDLVEERALIASRLAALIEAMADDNSLRGALLSGDGRQYVVNYATRAMRLAGLSMLQIQDERGRILSSGHFSQEFDRLEPELPALIASAPDGSAIVQARAPDGPFLALVAVDSVQLGARMLSVVGGVAVEQRLLERLARDTLVSIALIAPDDSARRSLDAAEFAADTILLPYVRTAGEAGGGSAPLAGASVVLDSARLVVAHPLGELAALRASVDRWFLAALAIVALGALLVAWWLSSRLGAPIGELAAKTERLDLDRLDVNFRTDREDEVGQLSRTLGAMTARLRTSAARLREAERRVAVGEVARQVNHDIKNGLAPIRHVLRHLTQVAREEPSQLPTVYLERQGTIEQSVAYLETLATRYAKLSPKGERRPVDANAVAAEVATAARGRAGAGVEIRTTLAPSLPPVLAEVVVLRRILENLVANAVESLEDAKGEVHVKTEVVAARSEPARVRITVSDTGSGMTERELARAFDDFFTTRPTGTGLGLSIVRRLVADLDGSLKVETGPGTGSRFTIELPSAAGVSAVPASARMGDSIAG